MAETTETSGQLHKFLEEGGVTYLLVKGENGQVEKKNLEDCDFLKGHCAMYFSAHWCPPCRNFTPLLAKKYKETDMGLTIIFMSSDKNQTAFDGYYKDMPWAAIPFEFKKSLEGATAFERPRGIPALYLFDDTGSLYSTSGRGNVMSLSFPYKDPSFNDLLPNVVELDENDELVPVDQDALKSKDYIVLYFSAHWCGPCRHFTPQFSKWYEKVSAIRDDFEIVFISKDQSREQMKDYFKTMSFKAFDIYGEDVGQRKFLVEFLSRKFGVQGIPTVVIVDKNGEVVCKDARGRIMQDSDCTGEGFPKYEALAVQDLKQSIEGINERPSIIVFCEKEEDDLKAQLEELLGHHGEEQKALGDSREVMHFISKSTTDGDIATRIRMILGKDANFSGMVILDIQNTKFYTRELPTDKEDVVNFYNEFKENVLEAEDLKTGN